MADRSHSALRHALGKRLSRDMLAVLIVAIGIACWLLGRATPSDTSLSSIPPFPIGHPQVDEQATEAGERQETGSDDGNAALETPESFVESASLSAQSGLSVLCKVI